MKRLVYTATVCLLFTLLFAALPRTFSRSEIFQKAILQTRDVFFKVRHLSQDPPALARQITLVRIDDESSQKLGLRWPWPRRTFAELVDRLTRSGAKVVGLNLFFGGLEDGGDASTRQLAEAMRAHGNVVVGATFSADQQLLKPNPIVAEAAARIGYLEKIIDPDFVIRRSYLLRGYSLRSSGAAVRSSNADDLFESSFPLALVSSYSEKSHSDRPHYDRGLGLLTVGADPHVGVYLEKDASYAVNYLAKESDFIRVPAWKVIEGKAAPSDLKGKVVIVGLASSLLGDTHPTPLGVFTGSGIHANEFLSIVTGRALRFVPDRISYLVSWLVSMCVLLLFLTRRLWWGLGGYGLTIVGLLLGTQQLFARDVVMEPFILLTGPTLATVFGVVASSLRLLLENRGLETKVIHDKMTGLYTYEYLRQCLEEEWKRCQRSKLPVSVVMTDLDRFKKINDTLGHEVGNDMIRRTGDVLRQCVRRYDVVSRYGGDEFVILLWHATLDEAKAFRLRLREMYHEMAKKLDDERLHDSSISIGVASYDPKVDPKYPPDPQRLVEDADKDLFEDKESRRKPGEPRR